MKQTHPRILITRPTGQHEHFEQACAQLGFSTSHLPCVTIEAIDTTELDSALPTQSSSPERAYFDTILFTSVNAVAFSHRIRPLPWPGVAVHAIGAATAHALELLDQPIALKPCAPYTSEAYLEQLQQIAPSRLLIVKGAGGRELIKLQLRNAGWQVNSADVYRRVFPIVDAQSVNSIFTPSPPDIVSVTSNEILENLMILAKQHQQTLLQLPLIVNSERCASLANILGFKQPALIAKPAGDTGQIQALQNWHGLFQTDAR